MDKQLLNVTIPAPRDAWKELLRQDPNALIFQAPEWIDSICQSGPYEDASRLFELPFGRSIVMPAVRNRLLPGGLKRIQSLPHGWGMGGLVAAGGVTVQEINQVYSLLSTRGNIRASIRPNPLQASQWRLAIPTGVRSQQHITHILSLEGGFDQVWSQQLSSATRNKIRKAEKSGLSIEKDSSGEKLDEFYQLYLAWSERRAHERHIPAAIARRLAQMREPYSKFRTVVDHMGEAPRLWIARLGGQMVAAAYLLVWGEHAIYWRSASDKELTLQTRANDLLQKVMIEDACRAGCRTYHMGESGGVASLMHFKSRFGAIEYPYEEYYLGHQLLDGFSSGLRSFFRRLEGLFPAAGRERVHETRPDD
jgi:CelD/BcsL family acetyltransferase involved in cellulose biosynthesis